MAEEIKSFIKEGFNPQTCSLQELETEMNRMKDLEDFYESKQLGEKLFLNSMYGAVSSKYFVGFNLEVSKSITLQGQDLNHYSEKCVNLYFEHPKLFKNDVALHQRLGIKTEDVQKIDLKHGRITDNGPLSSSPQTQKQLAHLKDAEYTLTVAGDTDSESGDTVNYLDGNKIRVDEMFTKLKYENNDIILKVPNGSEVVPVKNHTTKTFTFEDGVCDRPIKYVMRHKVTKSKWKLKTKSGKEIIVTGDHSLMVMRNNELISLKAKDVNVKTDKIITIKEN